MRLAFRARGLQLLRPRLGGPTTLTRWGSRGLAGGHGHSHSHGHGGGGHGHSHGMGLKDLLSGRPEDEKQRAARTVTLFGFASNIAFAAVKGVLGVAVSSHALIADAMHSVSDMVSDIATLIAVKFSSGRSPKFPYGMGKVENLAAFFVSGLLFVAGCRLLIQSLEQIISSLRGKDFKFPLLHSGDDHGHSHGGKLPGQEALHQHAEEGKEHGHAHAHANGKGHEKEEPAAGRLGVTDAQLLQIAVALAAVSVVVKEGMYRWTKRIANELRSPALQANAWHHRLDGLSSLVSLIGVAGNVVGLPILDPIAGALVSGMVVQMGAEIGWDNGRQLVDVLPNPEVMGVLEGLLKEMGLAKLGGEELSTHSPLLSKFRYVSIRARTSGRDVFVDLRMTVADKEEIATTTAAEIAEAITEVREHLKGTKDLNVSDVCVDFMPV